MTDEEPATPQPPPEGERGSDPSKNQQQQRAESQRRIEALVKKHRKLIDRLKEL